MPLKSTKDIFFYDFAFSDQTVSLLTLLVLELFE